MISLHPNRRGPSVAGAATLAQRSRRCCDLSHMSIVVGRDDVMRETAGDVMAVTSRRKGLR